MFGFPVPLERAFVIIILYAITEKTHCAVWVLN